ncbi:tetratricopeptide repeat protein [Mucilaginibacter sp. CSA2-8R]|uniref:tetratricopeptide repeat protein n=1 Tax=Mucilaginibacter sp. CSA2-8R TaxID=3141542 RepID=UPI00315CA2E0
MQQKAKFLIQLQVLIIGFLMMLPLQSLAQLTEATNLSKAQNLSSYKPDSALMLLKQVHARAVSNHQTLVAAQSLQQMGQVCYEQGHYAQALDFYQHAEQLLESEKQKDKLAGNWSKMGLLYYYNRQPKQAKKFYLKAHELYRQTGNSEGQAQVLGELGHLFEKQQQYQTAFSYQKQALAKYRQVGSKLGLAKIYENIGSIYEDLARYDSAYYYFNQSVQLYEKQQNTIDGIEVINNLGDVFRKSGRYQDGLQQSYKAYHLAQQMHNTYQIAAATHDLGKTYQLLNRLDSAYYYAELSRKLSLEIYSKDGLKQTSFLQVLYNFNKQNDEIARLNTIKKTNYIITVAVSIVVLLLIILGVVIFSRQRLKINDQRLLAERNEAIFKTQHELMQLELKNKQLQEETLQQQLELKGKELSSHTLNLIRNNQLLEQMRNTLQQMVKDDKRDQKKQMQQMVHQINQSFNHEQQWKEFTAALEQVHQRFFERLKEISTDLTPTDIRLIALIKVNMDSKDISGLLGISMDSLRVARHRLRKKLNLDQGENLSAFIQSL